MPIDTWGEVDLAELLWDALTPFDGVAHDRGACRPWAEGPLGRPAGAGRRRRCTAVRERGERERESMAFS